MAQTTCPLILIFSTLSWNHLYSYKTTSQYRIQHKPTTVNPIRSAEPVRGGGSPRHSETSHAGKLRFFSVDKRKQLLNHQLVCAVQRLKQIHLIYHTHVWFTTLNYSSAQDTLTLASFMDLPVSSQIICWSPDDWIDAAGAAVYVCC